jgi:hypothetical protein
MEHTVLEAEGALGQPSVLGHFLDQLNFCEADGLFVLDELIQEAVVFLLAFTGENAELSGEAVADCVLGHGGFACGGNRTAGFLGITAIGLDLFGSRHRYPEDTFGRCAVQRI